MLGIIHRSVLGLGPDQFNKYFIMNESPTHPQGRDCLRRHTKQLLSHRNGNFLESLRHSLLGLIDIYNLLPQYAVEADTVHIFQRRLQEILCSEGKNDIPNWQHTFSPRNSLWDNRLRKWTNYKRMHGDGPMHASNKNGVGSSGTAPNETTTMRLFAF